MVTFNPFKSTSLTFSTKLNKPLHPPLLLNNSIISEVTSHKHLGILLTQSLSWSPHIINITTQAYRKLSVMRPLSYKLPRCALISIYKYHVRPILEYASQVWDPHLNVDVNLLEDVQVRAAHLCTGALRGTRHTSIINDLGWNSLQYRRYNSKMLLLYKILTKSTPSYLTNLIPILSNTLAQYNTRSEHTNVPSFKHHTNRFASSFYQSAISAWNNLPTLIKSSKTYNQLKTHLLRKSKSPPPCYYNFGPRFLSILHTRLRLGFSKLQAHLHKHHLADSPLCPSCNLSSEDVSHFFLRCPTHALPRIEMLASVNNIITDTNNSMDIQLLLRGSPSLTTLQNQLIFQHVQLFIKSSNRFT